MTSQTKQQAITIHILLNISTRNEVRSVNRIEDDKYFSRKIIHKIWWRCWSQTFFKKLKLRISLHQQSEMFQRLFLLYILVKIYQNILKLRRWPFALTLYKAFYKTKKGLELAYLLYFLHDFWRKIFFMLYSMNWPNFVASKLTISSRFST